MGVLKRLLFLLIAIGAIGCSAPGPRTPATETAPRPAEPPALRVSGGGQVLAVVRGSSCWSDGGLSICADSIAPPLLALSLEPTLLPGETLLELSFAVAPLADSVSVSRWTDDEPRPVPLARRNAFALPRAPGEYVFSIFARWPQGDATYVVRVRVEPTPTS